MSSAPSEFGMLQEHFSNQAHHTPLVPRQWIRIVLSGATYEIILRHATHALYGRHSALDRVEGIERPQVCLCILYVLFDN